MIVKAIRLLSALAALNLATLALGGDLNPPSAPAPTPGPEPRTAIGADTTPGDADSVYRITESGSYYLTGDVTGESGKSGIEIGVSDVTLDLNGFSVAGVNGALDGILVDGTRYALDIHSGRVWGWPGDGVDASAAVRSRVTDVTATNNTEVGIRVGPRSLVERCTADANTGHGIDVDVNCVVSGCLAQINSGDGIVVSDRCRVSGCSAVGNTLVGITVEGDANHIEGNTLVDNGDWGIETGSTSENNAIVGNSVTGNGAGGIYIWDATSDNFVGHNIVSNNNGTGILDDNRNNEVFGNVAIGNTLNYNGADLEVTIPTTSTGAWANLSR
jgi:parallel beta-helix repeat protein